MDYEVTKEGIETLLKTALASKNYTLAKVVKALNEAGASTSVQNISNKLKRGTLDALELAKILDAIGCKISIVNK